MTVDEQVRIMFDTEYEALRMTREPMRTRLAERAASLERQRLEGTIAKNKIRWGGAVPKPSPKNEDEIMADLIVHFPHPVPNPGDADKVAFLALRALGIKIAVIARMLDISQASAKWICQAPPVPSNQWARDAAQVLAAELPKPEY